MCAPSMPGRLDQHPLVINQSMVAEHVAVMARMFAGMGVPPSTVALGNVTQNCALGKSSGSQTAPPATTFVPHLLPGVGSTGLPYKIERNPAVTMPQVAPPSPASPVGMGEMPTVSKNTLNLVTSLLMNGLVSDDYSEFECGYCGARKLSTSQARDGRVRIRCECGGRYGDRKTRMHARWTVVNAHPRRKAVLGLPTGTPSPAAGKLHGA